MTDNNIKIKFSGSKDLTICYVDFFNYNRCLLQWYELDKFPISHFLCIIFLLTFNIKY